MPPSRRQQILPTRSLRSSVVVNHQSPMRCEVVNVDPPVSPSTKKLQQKLKRICERNVQKQAFNELLVLIAANGGEIKQQYGSVQKVLTKYQKAGNPFVTRRNLEYRMELYRSGKELKDERIVPNKILTGVTRVSSLTSPSNGNGNIEETKRSNELNEDCVPLKKRKIKSIDKNLQMDKVKDATAAVALKFVTIKSDAKPSGKRVKNGLLASIINEAESTAGLSSGSIMPETVRTRLKKGNVTGVALQRKSPLKAIEPLIVEHVVRLGEIGSALTGEEIMALTSEIIKGTEYETELLEYKQKRNIQSNYLVGKAWYHGFIKRNQEKIKRVRCKVRDQKRLTWCTLDNFQNMYDSVYDKMVLAGVAEKVHNQLMYDKNGNETEDESLMVGRKTSYRVTKPSNIVFVDETGCNTNQRTDGYIGGRLHVLGINATDSGVAGAVTDLHFTVLCFTLGTGEPIMCAIIMKSQRDIASMPESWKLGIDQRKEYKDGETQYEIFENNFGVDKAMTGGPKCTVNGKNVPCFVGYSPKASITSQLLVQILAQLDTLNIFDRSENI